MRTTARPRRGPRPEIVRRMKATSVELRTLDPVLGERFDLAERYTGGEGWSAAVRERGAPYDRLLFLKVLDEGGEVREASLLASLRHPSIPRVLEVGRTESGRAYLLREHFVG